MGCVTAQHDSLLPSYRLQHMALPCPRACNAQDPCPLMACPGAASLAWRPADATAHAAECTILAWDLFPQHNDRASSSIFF